MEADFESTSAEPPLRGSLEMLKRVASDKINKIYFLTDGEFHSDEIHRLIGLGIENKHVAKIHVIGIGDIDKKNDWVSLEKVGGSYSKVSDEDIRN